MSANPTYDVGGRRIAFAAAIGFATVATTTAAALATRRSAPPLSRPRARSSPPLPEHPSASSSPASASTSARALESSTAAMSASGREQPSGPYIVSVCDVRLPDGAAPSLRLRLFYPSGRRQQQQHDSVSGSAARADGAAKKNNRRGQWFAPAAAHAPESSVASVLRFAGVPLPRVAALPLNFLASAPLPASAAAPLLPAADLAASPGALLPVVVFSHGLGGAVGNYSHFCIDRASHGALVAAPEHTDGSAFCATPGAGFFSPNGEASAAAAAAAASVAAAGAAAAANANSRPAPDRADGDGSGPAVIPYERYNPLVHGPDERPFRDRQVAIRVADCQAVLAALAALHAGGAAAARAGLLPLTPGETPPELAGRLDLGDVVYAGHSFGAATALALAAEREKLQHGSSTGGSAGSRGAAAFAAPRAVVCLDAWLFALADRLPALRLPAGASVLFVDMAAANMGSSIAARQRLVHPSPNTSATGAGAETGEGAGGVVVVDAVKVLGGMHNNSSDFPLRVPKALAVAMRMTAPESDPLALLQAQSKAANAFLDGPQEWMALRRQIARGEVPDLALAPLGDARRLPTTGTE